MKNFMMWIVILALFPFAACTVCAAVNTVGCMAIGVGSAIGSSVVPVAPEPEPTPAPVKKQRKAKGG